MNNLGNLSADQLRRAAQIKEQIESLENELERIIGGQGRSASAGRAGKIGRPAGSRGMSAEGKARIIAAQKARWAAYHKSRGTTPKNGNAGSGKRRKMSAAGRARIAEAQRRRWAAQKAA